MLHRLRRLRLVATGLAVCLIGAAALPLHAADDAYCSRPLADAEGDAVGPVASSAQASHCEVCHWIRSLRTLDIHVAATLLSPSDFVATSTDPAERPLTSDRAPILSRGPPA